MNMRLSWLMNGFICRELYTPFVVERDNGYLSDLKDRYDIILNQAEKAGADGDSLSIIKRYRKKIIEALRSYYKADVVKCNTIIKTWCRMSAPIPLRLLS